MKFSKYHVFIFYLTLSSVQVGNSELSDNISNHKNLSPNLLLELSKQLIFGLPAEVVISILNQICSAAIAKDIVVSKLTPDINEIKIELRNNCTKYTYSILDADDIIHSPAFDPENKVVILATGWRSAINASTIIRDLEKAFNCRGDVNFVVLDAAVFITTLYSWASLNTEDIGNYLAKGLIKLLEVVPLENIHLIGHSLGAHIVGYAGRNFTAVTGMYIPQITGLDPANPCFNEGESLSGLQRGDADFIDIVHSNSGVLGKRDPLGDVDFYPGGLVSISPGCFDIGCSHDRCFKYYAETIYPGNENNLMGRRCCSLFKLRNGYCNGAPAPLGYAVPHDIKGSYFLEVNPQKPYGLVGNKEKQEKDDICGLCASEHNN